MFISVKIVVLRKLKALNQQFILLQVLLLSLTTSIASLAKTVKHLLMKSTFGTRVHLTVLSSAVTKVKLFTNVL